MYKPVCPRRDLTSAAAERIVVRREMAHHESGSAVQRQLLEEYEYDALETCTADGTCVLSCPVGIDTGKLVKRLSADQRGPRAQRIAVRVAERWEGVERAARASMRAGKTGPGRGAARAVTGLARRALADDLIPQWPSNMPPPAEPRLPETSRGAAVAVYLPSCENPIFGRALGGGAKRSLSLPEALTEF